MRCLLPAALLLAASPAASQDVSRWGPVAEALGLGTAICTQEDPVICAVVLCRDAALSLGLMGVEYEDPEVRLQVGVEVDGEAFQAEMASMQIGGDVLYIGAPIAVGDRLWTRLRSGRAVEFSDREGEEARAFSLRGSAAELDRVAAGCR